MSCSCGLNTPPSPSEEKSYAPIKNAFQKIGPSFSKKITTFEKILIISILIIIYLLFKKTYSC